MSKRFYPDSYQKFEYPFIGKTLVFIGVALVIAAIVFLFVYSVGL